MAEAKRGTSTQVAHRRGLLYPYPFPYPYHYPYPYLYLYP